MTNVLRLTVDQDCSLQQTNSVTVIDIPVHVYNGERLDWFAIELVPAIDGDSIRPLAQSVRDGVVEKQPWYGPGEIAPRDPIIAAKSKPAFDTLVVDDRPRERLAA